MAESVARQRINWRVLGVEAAAIFLSVLLGFGVTEWRENRSEVERRDALLSAFSVEIAANLEDLLETGAYHHWLVSQISNGIENGDINRLSDVFQIENMNGFNPLQVERAAWATATATGDISLLDFKTASALWRLYEAQSALDTEQTRLRTIALDQIGNPSPQIAQRFAFILGEFTDLERELLFLMNSATEAISRSQGVSPPAPPTYEDLYRDPFTSDSVAASEERP